MCCTLAFARHGRRSGRNQPHFATMSTISSSSLSADQRRAVAAILRHRRAAKVSIDYVDGDGNATTRTIQIGVDIYKAHEKRNPISGAGSWLTHARHIGEHLQIAISKKGDLSLRALCNMRDEMRCFRLDRIKAARGIKL